MTTTVSTSELEALIAAAEADLAALLHKVNHQAHSKSDLHRVHFKQAEVQMMKQRLAERLSGYVAPEPDETPRAAVTENEYRVLVAAETFDAPTTFREVGAVVGAAGRAAGRRTFAADIVADQLALRGYLTGTRNRKRPDVTLTAKGREAIAASAPFYA